MSTPALAAAVSDAGGLGFLAGGSQCRASALRDDLDELKRRGVATYGVNLWVPVSQRDRADRRELGCGGATVGGEWADPAAEDPSWEEKLDLVLERRPPAVSFSVGVPRRDVVDTLHRAGIEVWITATTPRQAGIAEGAGADVLVLQGIESGAPALRHGGAPLSVLALLSLVRPRTDLPIVASGGIADGAALAAVLAATASAAQVGSALLLAAEAGTRPAARCALSLARDRADGRLEARTVLGRMTAGSDPAGAVLELDGTSLRLRRVGAAGAAGSALSGLFVGQTFQLAEPRPAAEIVRQLCEDAHMALEGASTRLLAHLHRADP